jgi:hypothetical protein
MKEIKLTKGKTAIVDDEDFDRLSQYKWQFAVIGYARRTVYVKGKKGRQTLYMHRDILATPSDMFTDHINGNRLDNRKENLRVCTQAENNRNRRYGNRK